MQVWPKFVGTSLKLLRDWILMRYLWDIRKSESKDEDFTHLCLRYLTLTINLDFWSRFLCYFLTSLKLPRDYFYNILENQSQKMKIWPISAYAIWLWQSAWTFDVKNAIKNWYKNYTIIFCHILKSLIKNNCGLYSQFFLSSSFIKHIFLMFKLPHCNQGSDFQALRL